MFINNKESTESRNETQSEAYSTNLLLAVEAAAAASSIDEVVNASKHSLNLGRLEAYLQSDIKEDSLFDNIFDQISSSYKELAQMTKNNLFNSNLQISLSSLENQADSKQIISTQLSDDVIWSKIKTLVEVEIERLELFAKNSSIEKRNLKSRDSILDLLPYFFDMDDYILINLITESANNSLTQSKNAKLHNLSKGFLGTINNFPNLFEKIENQEDLIKIITLTRQNLLTLFKEIDEGKFAEDKGLQEEVFKDNAFNQTFSCSVRKFLIYNFEKGNKVHQVFEAIGNMLFLMSFVNFNKNENLNFLFNYLSLSTVLKRVANLEVTWEGQWNNIFDLAVKSKDSLNGIILLSLLKVSKEIKDPEDIVKFLVSDQSNPLVRILHFIKQNDKELKERKSFNGWSSLYESLFLELLELLTNIFKNRHEMYQICTPIITNSLDAVYFELAKMMNSDESSSLIFVSQGKLLINTFGYWSSSNSQSKVKTLDEIAMKYADFFTSVIEKIAKKENISAIQFPILLSHIWEKLTMASPTRSSEPRKNLVLKRIEEKKVIPQIESILENQEVLDFVYSNNRLALAFLVELYLLLKIDSDQVDDKILKIKLSIDILIKDNNFVVQLRKFSEFILECSKKIDVTNIFIKIAFHLLNHIPQQVSFKEFFSEKSNSNKINLIKEQRHILFETLEKMLNILWDSYLDPNKTNSISTKRIKNILDFFNSESLCSLEDLFGNKNLQNFDIAFKALVKIYLHPLSCYFNLFESKILEVLRYSEFDKKYYDQILTTSTSILKRSSQAILSDLDSKKAHLETIKSYIILSTTPSEDKFSKISNMDKMKRVLYEFFASAVVIQSIFKLKCRSNLDEELLQSLLYLGNDLTNLVKNEELSLGVISDFFATIISVFEISQLKSFFEKINLEKKNRNSFMINLCMCILPFEKDEKGIFEGFSEFYSSAEKYEIEKIHSEFNKNGSFQINIEAVENHIIKNIEILASKNVDLEHLLKDDKNEKGFSNANKMKIIRNGIQKNLLSNLGYTNLLRNDPQVDIHFSSIFNKYLYSRLENEYGEIANIVEKIKENKGSEKSLVQSLDRINSFWAALEKFELSLSNANVKELSDIIENSKSLSSQAIFHKALLAVERLSLLKVDIAGNELNDFRDYNIALLERILQDSKSQVTHDQLYKFMIHCLGLLNFESKSKLSVKTYWKATLCILEKSDLFINTFVNTESYSCLLDFTLSNLDDKDLDSLIIDITSNLFGNYLNPEKFVQCLVINNLSRGLNGELILDNFNQNPSLIDIDIKDLDSAISKILIKSEQKKKVEEKMTFIEDFYTEIDPHAKKFIDLLLKSIIKSVENLNNDKLKNNIRKGLNLLIKLSHELPFFKYFAALTEVEGNKIFLEILIKNLSHVNQTEVGLFIKSLSEETVLRTKQSGIRNSLGKIINHLIIDEIGKLKDLTDTKNVEWLIYSLEIYLTSLANILEPNDLNLAIKAYMNLLDFINYPKFVSENEMALKIINLVKRFILLGRANALDTSDMHQMSIYPLESFEQIGKMEARCFDKFVLENPLKNLITKVETNPKKLVTGKCLDSKRISEKYQSLKALRNNKQQNQSSNPSLQSENVTENQAIDYKRPGVQSAANEEEKKTVNAPNAETNMMELVGENYEFFTGRHITSSDHFYDAIQSMRKVLMVFYENSTLEKIFEDKCYEDIITLQIFSNQKFRDTFEKYSILLLIYRQKYHALDADLIQLAKKVEAEYASICKDLKAYISFTERFKSITTQIKNDNFSDNSDFELDEYLPENPKKKQKTNYIDKLSSSNDDLLVKAPPIKIRESKNEQFSGLKNLNSIQIHSSEHIIESLRYLFCYYPRDALWIESFGLLTASLQNSYNQILFIDLVLFIAHSSELFENFKKFDKIEGFLIRYLAKIEESYGLKNLRALFLKNSINYLLSILDQKTGFIGADYLVKNGMKDLELVKSELKYQESIKDCVNVNELFISLFLNKEITKAKDLANMIKFIKKIPLLEKIEHENYLTDIKNVLNIKFKILKTKELSIPTFMEEIYNYYLELPQNNFFKSIGVFARMIPFFINKFEEIIPNISDYLEIILMNIKMSQRCSRKLPEDFKLLQIFFKVINHTATQILYCSPFLNSVTVESELADCQSVLDYQLNSLSKLLESQPVKRIIVTVFEILEVDRNTDIGYIPKNFESDIVELCLDYYSLHRLIKEFSLNIEMTSLGRESSMGGIISGTETMLPSAELKLTKSFSKIKQDISDKDISRLFMDFLLKRKIITMESLNIGIKGKFNMKYFHLCKTDTWILSLEDKKKILEKLLNREDGDSRAHGEFHVDRAKLIKGWKNYVKKMNTRKEIQKKIPKVIFKNEPGTDAGGLMREFFTILCKKLFSPDYGLFKFCEDEECSTIEINPFSYVVPNHLNYFELAGITIAKVKIMFCFEKKVLTQDVVVDVNFSKTFLKSLLDKALYRSDFESIDPVFYKSLVFIMENDPSSLEMDFTTQRIFLKKIVTKELIKNGENTSITQGNKKLFMRKFYEIKFKNEIELQMKAFKRGFNAVIPLSWISILNHVDLQMLISGPTIIDFKILKSNVSYSGYSENDNIIKWFWEILGTLKNDQLIQFLAFTTGLCKIPFGGFRRPIVIARINTDPSSLPTSHTCSFQIDLPYYDSKEILQEKLIIAINDGSEGFGFS